MVWVRHLKLRTQNYLALLSLVLDSLALPALEDAAIEIRFIDVGHGIHHGELTMSIFAVCRYVISNDASRIEPCFHFS